MDYENIVEDVGGFGHMQRLIFLGICVPDIPGSFALMLPVFIGSVPEWGCGQGPANQTHSHGNSTGNGTWINDLENTSSDDTDLCVTCSEPQFSDSFTTIVSEWNLICSRDYVSDVISSVQFGGMMIGATIFSQISDIFGRKKAHFASVLLLSVSGLLSAFSPNWQLYAASRLLVGVSTGGYFCVNCVYPLEFISSRWRTLCGTIGFWPLAQMLLALLAYLLRDWRYLAAVTSCFAFPYMFFWWFLPESPRWLIQRGRTEEAKAIFTNIALKNKKPVPDMDFLDSLHEASETKPKATYTFIDLFRTRVIAKLTIACALLWFTTMLAYYEVSYGVKNLSGNRYLNVVYGGLFDMIGLLAVIFFNNILGRRRFVIIGLAMEVVIMATIFTIYASNKELDHYNVITWISLVGKGVILSVLYAMQIYTAELFPTDVRNIGVGVATVFGRIGGLLAPQVLYLGTKVKLVPYALIGTLCSAVIPLCLLLPETSGRPLVDDINFKPQRDNDENFNLKAVES